jgi:hypothetical protein
MTVTPAPELLRALFDDASLFPPAALAMPAALAGHRRHESAWYAELCGAFVCAQTRLTELSTAMNVAVATALDLSLVVTGGAAGVAPALDAVAAEPRLRLRAVEVAVAKDAAPAEAAAAVATALDHAPLAAAAGYIELPIQALADQSGAAGLVALVDDRGYRPKLRTGGVTADAFPDEATLAAALSAVVERRVPFKCTAGLHHAVRHTAADTGFEHHGFLNVLLAVAAADDGADTATVARLLAERDPQAVAAQVAELDAGLVADTRHFFTSFGTCSIDEPVTDLVALGLAVKPA